MNVRTPVSQHVKHLVQLETRFVRKTDNSLLTSIIIIFKTVNVLKIIFVFLVYFFPKLDITLLSLEGTH